MQSLCQFLSLLLVLLGCLDSWVSCQTPAGFSPSTNKSLFVEFNNVIVEPGRSLPLDVPASSPSISFPHRQWRQTHLVLMVDLDAPFADANRSYSPLLHWLQPSIPAAVHSIPDNYTNSNVPAVAPYIRPQPPPGSAPHRYVILAFQQPQRNFSMPMGFLQYYDPIDVVERFDFNVVNFVEEAGLTLIAANWFTAQNTTEA